jgi:hypothetical protein
LRPEPGKLRAVASRDLGGKVPLLLHVRPHGTRIGRHISAGVVYMGVRQRGMPNAADPDGLYCLRLKPASAEDTMQERDRDHGHGVGC